MIEPHWKFFAIAAVVATVLFRLFFLQTQNGILKAEIKTYQERIKAAEIQAQERTDDLREQIEKISKESENEVKKSKNEIDNLRHYYNEHIKRLCANNSNLPNNSGTKNRKDEPNIDEGTGTVIAKIATTGDEAIIKLNACIDAYNAAREKVNKK